MKKLPALFVVLYGLFYPANVSAQSASATWPLSSTSLLSATSAGNVVGANEIIGAGPSPLMVVFDYTSNGQRLWKGTSGWSQESAQEDTRYVQFDVTPTSGNSLTVTSVSFNYGAAGANGIVVSNVYYSTNGWNTRTQLNTSGLLAYPASSTSPFSQNVSVAVAGGSTFSLRIYPYAIQNSSPMSPTFAVHNNVVINGTTASTRGSICGIKFNDLDGDGAQDSGELGLPNWVIKLSYSNAAGQMTVYDTTDTNGNFCFPSLQAGGTYTVSEINQSGWQQTYPSGAGMHTIALAAGQNIDTLKFGNKQLPTLGSICGIKFNDLDGDGVQDPGELGLQNWIITLSYSLAVGPITVIDTTDANGNFCFNSLQGGGTYTVSETNQSGWQQTYPGTPGTHTVTLAGGQNIDTLKFGNKQLPRLGSICGIKFNDLDGDGVQDPGELGLPNWIITLSYNLAVGPITVIDTTDASGNFCFNSLQGGGTYTVSETNQTGWQQTFPGSQGTYTIALAAGQNIDTLKFGNKQLPTLGSICGIKFNDLDGDGVQDPGELGLPNWIITLSYNLAVGPITVIDTTDANGNFCFNSLQGGGTYTVSETNQTSWQQTFPGSPGTHTIALAAGQNIDTLKFGNMQVSTNGCNTNLLNISTGWNHNSNATYNNLGSDQDVFWTLIKAPTTNGTVNLNGPAWVIQKGSSSWANPLNGSQWISAFQISSSNLANVGQSDTPYVFQRSICVGDTTDLTFNLNVLVDNRIVVNFVDANGSLVSQIGALNTSSTANFTSPTNFLQTISNVLPGTYFLRIELRNDNNNSAMGVNVQGTVAGASSSLIGTLCCDTTGSSITGYKFHDIDNDGIKDPNEVVLQGWTITLAGSGVSQSSTTDANGSYLFTGIPAGTYTLTETPQNGWVAGLTGAQQTVTIGTNQAFNNINFGNRQAPVGGVCDSLSAAATRITPGDCAWSLSLLQPATVTGVSSIQIRCLSPNQFAAGTGLGTNYQNWFTTGSNTYTSPSGVVPGGNLNNFFTMNLSYVTSPQIIVVDWLNAAGSVACSDTLQLDCFASCVSVTIDTVVCSGSNYSLFYSFMNNAGYGISAIEYTLQAPSTVTISPPTAVLSPTVASGSSSGLQNIFISGAVPGDTVRIQAKFKSPDGCCWCYETLRVVIPSCGSVCDSVSVQAQGSSTDCCYSISLSNNSSTVFSNLEFELLSGGMYSTATAAVSGWGFTNISPNNLINLVKLPIAQGIGNGTFSNVLNLCVRQYSSPTQVIEVRWIKNGQVVCRDTLRFQCVTPPPPTDNCSQTFNDTLICLPNGTFQYDFRIRNNSNLVSSGFGIYPTTPGVSFSQTNFPGVSIMPGQGSAMQSIIISGVGAGQNVCFQTAIYTTVESGGTVYNYCCHSDTVCVTIPVCAGRLGSICGFKFNDLNGNGVWDAGEPGLPDWKILIGGTLDSSVTTGRNGEFCFTGLREGVYKIGEEIRPGWQQTFPAFPGTYTITLSAGQYRDSLIFGNRRTTVPTDTCSYLCNPDFEDRQVVSPGSQRFMHQDSVPCWKTTTKDQIIEVWGSGFNGVPAYSGNQFVELNAYAVGTLFQDFSAIPGRTMTVSFAHRGRAGFTNQMSVSIGPVGGTATVLGTFNGSTAAWTLNSVTYTFPNNGVTAYVLSFISLPVGGTSAGGNFLDAISITCPPSGLGSICGVKFNDLNGNGRRDTGEPGLPNWQIMLTGAATSSATTDDRGQYCFNGLKAGTYTVSEVMKSGWWQSFPPPPGTYTITLGTGQNRDSLDFGNKLDPCINGTKTWLPLGSGINGGIFAIAVSGTDLYVVGQFTTAGGVSANNIAKWNGTSWSSLGSGINGTVTAITVSGTDLYAGGTFTTAGGVSANNIAKWNGTTWSALGSGINGTVFAITVGGTDLYAGGQFTTAGGVSANNIAKWNGTSWSSLGSGINATVTAITVSGTDLYAGGAFTTAGGVSANNIAKWNGTTWSALGSGINGTVYATAVLGADLYAGGSFTTAGGASANNIAEWNGANWSALGTGMNSSVRALAGMGTDLYVGGGFTTAGGIPANRMAKWNGTSWSALGSGMNASVYALAVSGTDLYAGGGFTTAEGVNVNYIAEYSCSVPTSVNEDRTDNVLPQQFQLKQNYPNPFNPTTQIAYEIPSEEYVSLRVYNALGEQVAVLVDGQRSAGAYTVTFQATDLPSGIYFYRLIAGEFRQTRKLLLLR